ncbi:hypothetical protein ACN4DJ_06385 [Corynebacterium macclintockiae]|uniref:hypothetical protein n=1 Tax=Corynebacterium macclintockiae TaxID=2913501 RepID=UPI003EC156D9
MTPTNPQRAGSTYTTPARAPPEHPHPNPNTNQQTKEKTMEIGRFETTAANRQPHLSFVNPPAIHVDAGEAEIKWLADKWNTDITPPSAWEKINTRYKEAPDYFSDLTSQERESDSNELITKLVNTDVADWDKAISDHAQSAVVASYFYQNGGTARFAQRAQEALQRAGKEQAMKRATRLDIAAQLDVKPVQEAFQAAATALGDIAWSQDQRTLARNGAVYTSFLENGAKIEALQHYLSPAMGTAEQHVPGICLVADVAPLLPLEQVSNKIMSGWVSSQEEVDEHTRRGRIAAEAREYFPDVLTKLAQGAYDGMKLDITVDPETIQQRIDAYHSWGKTNRTQDNNATIRMTSRDHQRPRTTGIR